MQETISREPLDGHLLPLPDTTINVSNCTWLVFDIDHQGKKARVRPLAGQREGGDEL